MLRFDAMQYPSQWQAIGLSALLVSFSVIAFAVAWPSDLQILILSLETPASMSGTRQGENWCSPIVIVTPTPCIEPCQYTTNQSAMNERH